MMRPSDEQLMAYADGELPDAEAAAIAALAGRDPAVARRIRAFAQSRTLLQQSLTQAEVPQRTLQFLRDEAGGAGRARRRLPRWLPLALAASCVVGIAVALLAGTFRGGGLPTTVAAAELHAVLDDTASGTPVERTVDGRSVEVLPLATLQRADGRYCREYSMTALAPGSDGTIRALACRDDAGTWHVHAAPDAAPGATADDTYRLAGESTPGAALQGARRLSPDEERAAMRAGWR